MNLGIALTKLRFATDDCKICMHASSQTRAPSATSKRKALQNTGPQDFRQSQFVDTRYTRGYTWWFLSVTDESCWRYGSSAILLREFATQIG